jgi:cytochrome P450
LWEQPDAFDPDRFAPEKKAKLHRHQYLPFGAGPRVCVGARFALMEALIILAHWLNAAQFDTVADHRVYPVGSVTLRPDQGMPLKVTGLSAECPFPDHPSPAQRQQMPACSNLLKPDIH